MGEESYGLRAKVWRNLTAGGQADSPLAGWVYLSPKFPTGVSLTDPEWTKPEVQRELAIFWLMANCEPFQVGNWSSYFSFGRGAFGTSPYGAPNNDTADRILKKEFGDAIAKDVLDRIAVDFAGYWTAKRPYPNTQLEPKAEIAARLEAIIGALESWPPPHGELGHNSLSVFPVGEQERSQIIGHLRHARVELDKSPAAFRKAWEATVPFLKPFADWLLNRMDDYFTALAKSAGEATGKILPAAIIAGAVSAKVWTEWNEIKRLLELFAQ